MSNAETTDANFDDERRKRWSGMPKDNYLMGHVLNKDGNVRPKPLILTQFPRIN